MVDYLDTARKLRAKAADKVTPEAERAALIERAEYLEKKYGNASSRSTNDTTTTSRDGHTMTYSEWLNRNYDFFYANNGWRPPPPNEAERERRQREAERIAEQLKERQWMWNREYYDRDGKPYNHDPDDLIADEYKHDNEEDEDYDPTKEWYT